MHLSLNAKTVKILYFIGMIVLAVLGFNFVGDGLRDAFDPKLNS